MMPDLVQGPEPIQYRFAVSLPHSVLATASLLCAAPRFEGLAEQLHVMRGLLSPELRDDLCLLMCFAGGYQRFSEQLMARLPAGTANMTFDAFIAHLEATPPIHYQWMALRALARGAGGRPAPAELFGLSRSPDRWATYLTSVESEAAPAVVAALVADGVGLKERLLLVLRGFWQAAYAGEFAATLPLMERSVAHHRLHNAGLAFHALFPSVTGRQVPERLAGLLPGVRSVIFCPSYYVGPYVAYSHYRNEMVVFYNCRSTPPLPAVTGGAALYPPLKALADETRLQIVAMLGRREMYAQEIVDRLDISQPAVSRHLNLMAAAGVLTIRREGNAKYYSVDQQTLSRVADAIRRLA
jgi:hypothetical protein